MEDGNFQQKLYQFYLTTITSFIFKEENLFQMICVI